jgi:hypothetical protein
MSGWAVFGLFVWTVLVFGFGFFVGGKHKAKLMAKVEETKLAASDVIRDAGKKF